MQHNNQRRYKKYSQNPHTKTTIIQFECMCTC